MANTLKRKRPPFTIIENAVIEDTRVGKNGLLVYLTLCKYADAEGSCFPSIRTIGKVARIGTTNAQVGLKELIDLEYIHKETRFRDGTQAKTSNLYTIGVCSIPTQGVSDTDTGGVSYTDKELYSSSKLDIKNKNKSKNVEKTRVSRPPTTTSLVPIDTRKEAPKGEISDGIFDAFFDEAITLRKAREKKERQDQEREDRDWQEKRGVVLAELKGAAV